MRHRKTVAKKRALFVGPGGTAIIDWIFEFGVMITLTSASVALFFSRSFLKDDFPIPQ